jgi:hypothetical protein
MILKPQDVVVLLKLVPLKSHGWSYGHLAVDLSMSPSEVHAAIKRAIASRLAVSIGESIRPNIRNLLEFLTHGIQYVFIPDRTGLTRGIPTGFAALPMRDQFYSGSESVPVWPDPEGNVRGEGFSPLYPSVPIAAKKDENLYALLAIVDAIRGGKARERKYAQEKLGSVLNQYDQS